LVNRVPDQNQQQLNNDMVIYYYGSLKATMTGSTGMTVL